MQREVMIDGFNLALPHGTGVATYGVNLALALRDLNYRVSGLYGARAPFNPRLREIMFYESLGNVHQTRSPRLLGFNWWREIAAIARPRRARLIPRLGDGTVIAEQFAHRLPDFDRLFTAPDLFDLGARHFRRFGTFLRVKVPEPPAIMHWTYPVPVKLVGAKNIYTLHDLVPLRLPFTTLDNKRRYYKLIRKCVDVADHIVTVSDASVADIEMLFPAARGKTTNTYQAVRVPPATLAMSDEEVTTAVASLFGLKHRGYFLFFGAVEPKKNVGRLIEAYLALGTSTPLVVVGTRAWGSEAELKLLQRDEVQPLKATFKNVRRIDYLPRSLLFLLVRGAKAVAFPSLYEGFGLPVLEAMALGTPVITSTRSSLPEVAGDAALYADPYKPADITAALRALDHDPELAATMRVKGLAQAAKYDMPTYRARLSAMYDAILS